MTASGKIGFVAFLLILFVVSAWGGYAYRARQARAEQYEQQGWCCMLERRECVIAEGLDACEAQGGASFDWDRGACDAVCHPPVRRGARKP